MNYSNELENFKLDSQNIKNQLSEYCSSINKRYESALNTFEKSQSNINDIKNQYEKTIEQLNQKHLLINTDLENKVNDLQKRNKELLDEMASLKKVSLLSAMNKQLHEKDLTIDMLQKRIDSLKQKLAYESPTIKTPVEIINIVPIEIQPYEIEKHIESEQIKKDELVSVKQEENVIEHKEELDDEVQDEVIEEDEELNEEEVQEAEVEEDEQEEVVEEEVNDEEEVQEEEEEIEYEVKKIGKKYYYISNEEPIGIYTVNKTDNSVGDKVGEYDGDKPLFY